MKNVKKKKSSITIRTNHVSNPRLLAPSGLPQISAALLLCSVLHSSKPTQLRSQPVMTESTTWHNQQWTLPGSTDLYVHKRFCLRLCVNQRFDGKVSTRAYGFQVKPAITFYILLKEHLVDKWLLLIVVVCSIARDNRALVLTLIQIEDPFFALEENTTKPNS